MKFVICLAVLLVAVNASVIRETQTDLGGHIQTELSTVLQEIEAAVESGKTVAHDLLSKGHTLLEQAKTIGGQVWHAAQGELAKLTDGASGVFGNFLKGVSSIWHEIQHIFGKRSAQRRFLLDDLTAFNARLSKDMQTLFHDIKSHVHDFNTYLGNLFKEQMHNAQPVIDNVKQLAENFLNATAAKSQDVIKQAKVFFEPYKHDLGELWTEIECEYNHLLHSGPACVKSRRETANLEAELKQVIADVEAAVASGGKVAHDLLDKGKTLLEQAKTVGGQIWANSKDQLKALSGEAKTVFSGFLSGVSHLWHEVNHIIGKRDLEKRFLLDSLKELYSHLSHDLQSIFSNLGTQFHAFNDYLLEFFKKQATAAKPVVDNIKTLAHNFLTATKEKSHEVVTQAKTFFEPYKHDLGELWGQIECTYNHVVHGTDTACHDSA